MDILHWKTAMDKEFIGAHDLYISEGVYGEIEAVISGFEMREVINTSSKKQLKPVIFFEGSVKPLILNITNGNKLGELLKTATPTKWFGRKIVLGAEYVKSPTGGKTWGIRVKRLGAESTTKPELSPNSPNWAGALEAIKTGAVTLEKVLAKYTVSAQDLETLKAAKDA